MSKTLNLLLACLCAALLTACSESDDVAETKLAAGGDGVVDVRLRVTVAEMGDLNNTRVSLSQEDVTEDNEFMNTLCVFVVNSSGEIELRLEPALQAASGGSADGTVSEYISGTVELPAGEKTIYAFSNWQGMDCDGWNALVAKQAGDVIEAADLEFSVADPASLVSPSDGVYIPMSGSATFNLDASDLNQVRTISVGLDRLVGKVAVYIDGDLEEDVGLGSLTVSGWGDRVGLLSTYTPSDISYTGSKTFDMQAVTVKAGSADNRLQVFYVNETLRSLATDEAVSREGYSITLRTADIADGEEGSDGTYDDTRFFSTTERLDIPRNSVYPLSLTLRSYELEIAEANAWLAGIDTEEMPYLNAPGSPRTREGSNLVTLSEKTTRYTLGVRLLDQDGEEVEGVTWAWDYGADDELTIERSVSGDGTVTARRTTATVDYRYPFTLLASWTSESQSGVTIRHSRTYRIVVWFTDISYSLSP